MGDERLAVNRAKIVHETFEGEVIIINLDTGTYYSTVETGLDVWRAVERGLPRRALIEALAKRHDQEPTTVAAIDPFVDELLAEEIVLLEPHDGASPAAPELEDDGTARPFSAPTLERHTNMSDLLLLDPIHDVDEQGWPNRRPD